MINLAAQFVDRVVTSIAGRYGFRVLALEMQVSELRRDIATTRTELDHLRSLTQELYIGPIAEPRQ